jgi:acetyl esterase/lipase
MNLLTMATSALGLFGQGRSPAAFLNFTVPRHGYRVERDIPYGTGPRHRMDLYAPELAVTRGARGLPVVVFFYGGAFRAGRKSEYRFVGEALATLDIIVVVPDYRIYPEARFPDFLDDTASAITKLREIVARHGGDPENLFIAGHSAGAYIAVMLAANPDYLRAHGGDVSWIKGVIALSGRYHESALQDRIAESIFRGPARDETRPARFIDGVAPPMLLGAGTREHPVVLDAKQNLAEHLRSRGSEVEEVIYPGVGHAGIVAALAPGFRNRAPVRKDIAAFVAKHRVTVAGKHV